MNASTHCHEIEDCPGLYVDAFRIFRDKLQDANNNFILTHYHGDHYNGLPREYKYQGPAKIHCTPVTAALLKNVHQVPFQFIVQHEYGATWNHTMNNSRQANVTFLDANHCPGAAIVLIELPDGTCHLHTGDMRYHEKIKSYPLLQKAVSERKMGVVYLDTTYGHPKHELIPQETAVHAIASYVDTVMKDKSVKTLVLLSCYSIGKEKVLWEASKRANHLVYVTEKKYKMLQCIQGYQEDESSQILIKCTLDPTESDIHVIPMGVAGEIWPYFQPNYRACADYVENLDKQYDRVVAFLPTGWADSTNWNKKNAVCQRRLDFKQKDGYVDIEIRLVCYSEHSAFPELCTFVEYLRPRQVVPTVFSDENDRRRIVGHFRTLVDTSRAKHHFFKSMKGFEAKEENDDIPKVSDPGETKGENKVIDVDASSPSESKKRKLDNAHDEQIATLVSMGFKAESAKQSLDKSGGDVEAALNTLLGQQQSVQGMAAANINAPRKSLAGSKSSPATIKSFFSPKPKAKS